MEFDGGDELWECYFHAVSPSFGGDTVLLIDDSDISKMCSNKLEGICKLN